MVAALIDSTLAVKRPRGLLRARGIQGDSEVADVGIVHDRNAISRLTVRCTRSAGWAPSWLESVHAQQQAELAVHCTWNPRYSWNINLLD